MTGVARRRIVRSAGTLIAFFNEWLQPTVLSVEPPGANIAVLT